MSRFSQPLTQLIHENLSIVVTFAFSRGPLEALRQTRFRGEWKYLDKALFVVAEQRADKACVELATVIRLLDDDEDVSGYLREASSLRFGRVFKQDQPDEPLYLRDLTNKIIHAQRLEWDLATVLDPRIICISRHPNRWLRAEIELVALAAFCGQLMG